MRINNNLMAMNTHRQLGINANNGSKSIEKLSSGYRINRAGDDAAGLAISEKMRGQIRGLNQASRNSQDGISMIQTAEGALNETQAILQRMRELAVQSANDTNVNADRGSIQNEIDQLSTEITRISETTEFNTQKLLNGSLDDVKFQIGANESQNMGLSIGDMRANALNIVSTSTNLVEAGNGVEGVEADVDFNVEGVKLTATQGGAVAAVKTGAKATVAEYAADIAVSVSTGVTNTEGFTFDGSGVTLTNTGDVPWDSVATSGGLSSGGLKIAKSGNYVTVNVAITGSGNNSITVDDAILANASGDFVYENHGVKFTISKEEFASTSGAASFQVDFDDHGASGNDIDFTGTIQGNGNLTETLSGTSSVSFVGDKITLTATDDQWLEGAGIIEISGKNLETSGGDITVTIKSSGGAVLSQDTFRLASGDAFMSGRGATANSQFAFDNHGVSFTIDDLGSAKGLKLTQKLDYIEESITGQAGDDLKFSITDAGGATKVVTVDLDTSKAYSLSGVVDEINKAASGAGAGSNIATLDAGKIVLTAKNTGSGSTVSGITTTNANIGISTSGTNGSAASIDFLLKDSAGATIDSGSIATDAGTVTFQDSTAADANEITFDLKEYTDLAGVNVATEFAVDDIAKEEAGIDVSTRDAASEAITTINNAIESVSKERSKLGAVQNRLEHTIKNLDTSSENLQASESRIRDVDMAKEMMEFTKNNILQQAAQSMLAQANQAPQGVLQLLR